MDTVTRLGSYTALWALTCHKPGLSLPHGLVTYKVRALSDEAARDQLYDRHPDWTVLAVEREPASGRPVRLGEMMATERP